MSHEEFTLKLKLTHINNWIAPLWQSTMLIYTALHQPMAAHSQSELNCAVSTNAFKKKKKKKIAESYYIHTPEEDRVDDGLAEVAKHNGQHKITCTLYSCSVCADFINCHHCTAYVHNCLQQHNITQENSNRGMHSFFPLYRYEVFRRPSRAKLFDPQPNPS